LHEAKDPQAVDVVAKRQAIFLHYGLYGLDVGPSGLTAKEVGKQEFAAVVIDGRD